MNCKGVYAVSITDGTTVITVDQRVATVEPLLLQLQGHVGRDEFRRTAVQPIAPNEQVVVAQQSKTQQAHQTSAEKPNMYGYQK